MADRLVRAIARLASFGWFRTVEVTGLERIPRTGALVVAANHQGGFVDPVLLLASLPRTVRFLAMASLWRIWPLRPLLALAGAIPVQRAQDGDTSSNTNAFAACFDHLREGGAVGIFPEGRASDEARLLPLRTGASRIALGAHSRGAMGLQVVPVGLIYEDKQRARSRAFVRVGEPIVLDRDPMANPGVPPDETDRVQVLALTEAIEQRLAAAAMDFESADQRSALRLAAEVALRWGSGDPRGRPPIGDVERLTDRLALIPSTAELEVRQAAEDYREILGATGVPDAVVVPGAEEAFSRRGRAGWILALVLAPIAAIGAAANLVPALAIHLAGRRAMAPVTRATVKFLTALVLCVANWLALRAWVFSASDHPWIAALVVGPVCGLVTLWWVARYVRARRARLGIRRLAGSGAAVEDLRARRAWLVSAVGAAIGDPAIAIGRPPAEPP